jgi:hypothetical protein
MFLALKSRFMYCHQKHNVATFLRFKNVLLETKVLNRISSKDILVLSLIKEMAFKIFGVSFQILCVDIQTLSTFTEWKQNIETEDFAHSWPTNKV